MQSVILMVVFVLTVITIQSIGFVISRLVDYQYPTFGLMTFLILFMGAFFMSWPIAVRIAEFGDSPRWIRVGDRAKRRRSAVIRAASQVPSLGTTEGECSGNKKLKSGTIYSTMAHLDRSRDGISTRTPKCAD